MMLQLNKFLMVLKNLSPIAMALWLSVSLHTITFAVKFEPEIREFAKRLPSLEVVLVNAKTKNAPKKAELIAQANLDRGGNTDLDRKMKTALPAPKQKTAEVKLQPSKEAKSATKATKLQAREAREEERVAELEKKAQALFTQLNSERTIETKPIESTTASEPDDGQKKILSKTFDREALLAASLEIDRLESTNC